MHLGALSTIFATVGGAIGSMIGTFAAIAKLMPERASIIINYQSQVIDDLQSENKRLYQLVADLEKRVTALEDSPPRYLS